VLPEQTTTMRRAETGSLIFYLLDVNEPGARACDTRNDSGVRSHS
jgi:hypothetical protein